MPNVILTGSSPPPVSGSVEDPNQPERAETLTCSRTFPDPGLPEQNSVEVLEPRLDPERQHAEDEKTPGDVEFVSGQSKKREEVIKGIGISSSAFIGPACRPQPVIEDELSEFYKELAQIDQPDTGDGNNKKVSQSCASSDTVEWCDKPGSQFGPPHTEDGNSANIVVSGAPLDAVDGNCVRISHSWAPSDSLYRNNTRVSRPFPPPDTLDGNFEGVYHQSAPLINPPGIKEKGDPYSHTYRSYPAPWPHAADRNTPRWRPQPYSRSDPHRYPNQWQLPSPNFQFHPPPPNPMYRPYPHPHRERYGQIHNSSFWPGPDLRPAPCHGPAAYEAFDRWQCDDQEDQDMNQRERYDDPALVMILMRGLPGSGKTTLARQISSRGPSGLILSTDDYFYQKDGYHFEPALLGAAHTWNQNRAKKAMLDGNTPVIIDNTNVQAWEMKPYVEVALEMGYRVEFVEPDTSWKCDPVELEKRNHHGVPEQSLINMLDRFELPISVDIVMNSREPYHKRNEHHSRQRR